MIVNKRKFTTAEIIKITGIRRSTLQAWKDASFIIPSFPGTQGKKDYYLKEDIFLIEFFKSLIACGFQRKLAKDFLKQAKTKINEIYEVELLDENNHVFFPESIIVQVNLKTKKEGKNECKEKDGKRKKNQK